MKKTMFRNSIKTGVGLFLLLAVCIVILCIFYPPFRKSSSQSDYPVLKDSPFAYIVDLSFPEYVAYADLIVDATVKQVLPKEKETYVPEEGSPEQKIQEKQGSGNYEFEYLPVELEINEIWAGTVDSPTILLRIPAAGYQSAPDFQPGDRMIFFLNPGLDGPYYLCFTKGGLYYVAFDEKVYPAMLSDTLKDYSGKRLRDFKRDVQEAWAQKETPSEQ